MNSTSLQSSAQDLVEATLKREKEILSEMRIAIDALRAGYNATLGSFSQRSRSVSEERKRYHRQLQVLVPLYRAAYAYFQPNRQVASTGRQICCHSYGKRLNALTRDLVLEISMEPIFRRMEHRYPDILDLPIFEVGIVRGHQALIEGKTLRASFSELDIEMKAEKSAARQAYAELIDSLTPKQRELIKKIAKSARLPFLAVQLKHLDMAPSTGDGLSEPPVEAPARRRPGGIRRS